VELIVHVLACLAEGIGIRATARVFEDSMQLWRETQALGYAHSARTVSRFITWRQQASAAGWVPETQTSPYTRPQGPSARAVSFPWGCPEAKRAQDA
jgi:hypothetical protein